MGKGNRAGINPEIKNYMDAARDRVVDDQSDSVKGYIDSVRELEKEFKKIVAEKTININRLDSFYAEIKKSFILESKTSSNEEHRYHNFDFFCSTKVTPSYVAAYKLHKDLVVRAKGKLADAHLLESMKGMMDRYEKQIKPMIKDGKYCIETLQDFLVRLGFAKEYQKHMTASDMDCMFASKCCDIIVKGLNDSDSYKKFEADYYSQNGYQAHKKDISDLNKNIQKSLSAYYKILIEVRGVLDKQIGHNNIEHHISIAEIDKKMESIIPALNFIREKKEKCLALNNKQLCYLTTERDDSFKKAESLNNEMLKDLINMQRRANALLRKYEQLKVNLASMPAYHDRMVKEGMYEEEAAKEVVKFKKDISFDDVYYNKYFYLTDDDLLKTSKEFINCRYSKDEAVQHFVNIYIAKLNPPAELSKAVVSI